MSTISGLNYERMMYFVGQQVADTLETINGAPSQQSTLFMRFGFLSGFLIIGGSGCL